MRPLRPQEGEFGSARTRPQHEGHAAPVRQIEEVAGIAKEKLTEILATIEAKPMV